MFFPLKFNPILHTYYVGYWKTEMGRGETEGGWRLPRMETATLLMCQETTGRWRFWAPAEALVCGPPMCLFCLGFLFPVTSNFVPSLCLFFFTSMTDANKNPASVLMIHFTSVSQMCMQFLVWGGKWHILNHHKHAIMNSIYATRGALVFRSTLILGMKISYYENL